MPRPNRIEFSGAWYLVENQAINNKKIFQDDEDRHTFLDLIGEASQMFRVEIHAYVLLDDRYVLLVHTPHGQMSRAMRHLNGVYTQKFHQLSGTSGAIFKGRYSDLVIDPAHFLNDAVRYIHNMPVEESLCRHAVDYKWCSHQAYFKDHNRPDWLKTDLVLRPLGFIRPFALAKLSKQVAEGPSDDFLEALNTERSIMGDANFKKQVQSLVKTTGKKKVNAKNIATPVRPTVAGEILDFVSFAYKVPVNEIKTSVAGVSNEARSMAVYQLRKVAGLAQNEIAKVVRSKSGYTVAKTIERFQTKIESNPELARMTKRMTDAIQAKVKM